jgi:uncharacterized membrane protein
MKIVYLQTTYAGNEKKQLLLFTAFCFALLVVRMFYTHSFEYRFMGINLCLAWIPYLFALRITKLDKKSNSRQIAGLLFLWFIFFPNAPYMLTDMFHLHEFNSAPMWYDLIMLLTFAYTGMMLTFFSFRKLHRKLLTNSSKLLNTAVIFIAFFSSGIGIYLGRYERWNSWEIITKPATLTQDFLLLLNNNNAILQMGALSLVFATFFTLLYFQLFGKLTSNQISDKA